MQKKQSIKVKQLEYGVKQLEYGVKQLEYDKTIGIWGETVVCIK